MADGIRCSELRLLTKFDTYIIAVKNETNFTRDALEVCKTEICLAIWGETNPDISGIGVSIGYAVDLCLGFCFAIATLLIQQRRGRKWEFFQVVTKRGFEAFFEFAVYFAIAVELATIIMLVNKDFGVTTADFGANEAQNALAIAVVCVIPLVYPIALLPARMFHPESAVQHSFHRKPGDDARRHVFRLILFCLVVTLFFYPFLSQCIHNWGPLRIGEGGGGGGGGETLITAAEWALVKDMCFGSIDRFTDVEHWLLAVCEIIASLLIFLFTLWHAMGVGLKRWRDADDFSGTERKTTVALSRAQDVLQRGWHGHRIMLLFLPVVLGSPILWCIFRLRRIQAEAAAHMDNEYPGDNWGFGQIVGIIIFAPVVADMAFAGWSARSLLGLGEYEAVVNGGTP
ncbi:hypothetical protein CkaCkLH20_10988 [Colletotrichum karsti]|uniref:Uncharacterized protein n=1 Tax=Colletotrichum karsti TaxID=1095194 RepID=A0A9P6LGM4_9PEZI|nr:uncharacterized protein CkaCkLH20_10988 [Colletotrichum karsti]KAF9871577.1 hypothetical protein CkaCkLH20_10988 [Colletotrichum karsti]